MPSTFFGLDISVSGMHAYNAALNTTGHNISNIGTEGYTKQTVTQTASEAYSVGGTYGMLGTGVTMTGVVSARDVYYDMKYWSNSSTFGKYEVQSYYLKNIEGYLYSIDEQAGGVTSSIDNFFNTLTNLTTDVSDITKRTQALICADTFTAYLQEVGNELQQLQVELNNEIKSTVDAINSYSEEIASLTKQINTLEVYGEKANDLRDQRAHLVDELSKLADVEALEHEPADEGTNQYIVTIGGTILVDTYNANKLVLTTEKTKNHQNDAPGMYSIAWDNGQDFNMCSKVLGGKLQGLIELRDGNNNENFKGTIIAASQENAAYDGKSTVTIKSSEVSGASVTNLNLLNIPETKGKVTVSNIDLEYDSFDVTIGADGTYTYTFVLSDNFSDEIDGRLQTFAASDVVGRIGSAVDYKGVPYYMAELNEFARVFSAAYNEVHNAGYDLNGDFGEDLFVGKHPSSGEDYDMEEFVLHTDGNYYLNGEVVTATDTLYEFSSVNETGKPVSYYNMTILNLKVKEEVVEDPRKMALSTEDPTVVGVSQYGNITKLVALRNDKTMFKEGNPVSYLQVMVARVGVESGKVKTLSDNAENIVASVDNMRLSISGVDEDEEGTNLIRFQNLLNYQYKVLSVMDEVLDKLINQTAV